MKTRIKNRCRVEEVWMPLSFCSLSLRCSRVQSPSRHFWNWVKGSCRFKALLVGFRPFMCCLCQQPNWWKWTFESVWDGRYHSTLLLDYVVASQRYTVLETRPRFQGMYWACHQRSGASLRVGEGLVVFNTSKRHRLCMSGQIYNT